MISRKFPCFGNYPKINKKTSILFAQYKINHYLCGIFIKLIVVNERDKKMETKYFFSKAWRLRVEWSGNDNDDMMCYNVHDGARDTSVGSLIMSFGSKSNFFAYCITKEQFDAREAAYIAATSPERMAEQRRKASEREAAIATQRKEAYEALVAAGLPIQTTYDNIGTVLRYLNTTNWGGWDLPAMTIGYRCNQYDCDGKQASTMILDKPIEVYGEMVDKFVVGAPHGHLTKYHRC